MMLYAGDFTIGALNNLAAKGYDIEVVADSEYVNVTKAEPAQEPALEQQA